MCITSRKADLSTTRILVSLTKDYVQVLYQMKLKSDEKETTMVLPIPAKVVEFVDTSSYPNFFQDLEKNFNVPTRGGLVSRSAGGERLAVHIVGKFSASHVPSKADVDRLDPAFVIPAEVFEAYDDETWSYVAFRLTDLSTKESDMHAMGFRYPRGAGTFADRFAFYPCKHFHGTELHETEQYDHALFLQGSFPGAPSGWRGAEAPHMPYVRRCAFFDPTLPVYKKNIRGKWANGDVLVDLKTAITHMATTKMPSPKDKTVSVPAILQAYNMSAAADPVTGAVNVLQAYSTSSL